MIGCMGTCHHINRSSGSTFALNRSEPNIAVVESPLMLSMHQNR